MSNPHEWVASTLGHGETMCSRCRITNREAAVLGRLNHCEVVPAMPLRYSTKFANINKGPDVHYVYDDVIQVDVFHWHGPNGKEKCDAVATALNALNHGKD
jgi:hypothetical protein